MQTRGWLAVALATLAVTLPLAGCLSAAQLPGPEDVVSLHVHTRVEGDRIGYHVNASSPEGQQLVNLTLDAVGRAQGPVDQTAWDRFPRIYINQSISLSFHEPRTLAWGADGPAPIQEVRGLQLVVTPTNVTPNLMLRTADNWTLYQTPADTPVLEEAAEQALDVIRAENGGELPHNVVEVKRPNATAENTTRENGTNESG